ncbi:MAG: PP2C family serine/threonine-protein phosphatase, partial [Ilumatobacteraceae bacterium]
APSAGPAPGPGPTPSPVAGEALAAVCPSCGGTAFEDGFCSTCGARRPTWRDRYTETPTDWLAGVCDRGIVHARNEDAMALAAVGERAVLVVCDGVTSAPDSDRASLAGARAACEVLSTAAAAPDGTAGAVEHWTAQLVQACAAANREAVAIAHVLGDPREPPSSTFVAAVADDDLIVTAWCGDSRAYWLGDDGRAEQLTVDHSLGTQMVAAGRSRAEAEADPTSHTITRWLGADSVDATPECRSLQITGAGWLLVCSDGLWNYASDGAELAALVASAPDRSPLAVAGRLVEHANAGGGQDNITVVVARLGRDAVA